MTQPEKIAGQVMARYNKERWKNADPDLLNKILEMKLEEDGLLGEAKSSLRHDALCIIATRRRRGARKSRNLG